jgi:hypothetical protein
VAAGLVLVATSLSGCGGGSGAPGASASTADFCDAYNSLYTAFASADPNDDASAIKALKDWAKRMQDVGTPDGIPADAGRGLELIIRTAAEIDDNATKQQLDDLSSSFTPAQQQDGDAFDAWANDTCPDPFEPAPPSPSGT